VINVVWQLPAKRRFGDKDVIGFQDSPHPYLPAAATVWLAAWNTRCRWACPSALRKLASSLSAWLTGYGKSVSLAKASFDPHSLDKEIVLVP
jgi:hypothetical protein